MGRPARQLDASHHYHLINRGIDGQDLFAIHSDRLVFEAILEAVCGQHGLEIAAYALMSNHFHLLGDLSSCAEPADVSRAMAEIQSGYARHFNTRTQRRGPLFEPRFLGYPVSGEAAFARTTRYIHANPIDITGARSLCAYRWSSLPVYLNRRDAPPWMATEPLASMIDPDTYLSLVTERRTNDVEPFNDLPPLRCISTSILEDSLSEVVGQAATAATPLRHRRLVMMLGLDLRVADVVELAERFGCTPTHVRREAQRGRSERIDDPTFDALATAVQRQAAHYSPG